jgi:hypothetical protein
MVEEAYTELDSVQTELDATKKELIYSKAVVFKFKKKYPEEDISWAMKENEA